MCVGTSIWANHTLKQKYANILWIWITFWMLSVTWHTAASRRAGKLLCQRQDKGSPVPSSEHRRHCYLQWGAPLGTNSCGDPGSLPQCSQIPERGPHRWIPEQNIRETSSSIKGRGGGNEHIRQKTTILGTSLVVQWLRLCTQCRRLGFHPG